LTAKAAININLIYTSQAKLFPHKIEAKCSVQLQGSAIRARVNKKPPRQRNVRSLHKQPFCPDIFAAGRVWGGGEGA
jgi:hypothetical protein